MAYHLLRGTKGYMSRLHTTRTFRIFRYDPARGGEGRFDRYELEIEDETFTTILDVLIRLQKEQDPTLAFRYACRVNMCGSCGMVINGREALACKSNVSDYQEGGVITIRPLNHFPVIKDLMVDLEPFFEKLETTLPWFDPKEETSEPAVIRPDSGERRAIGLSTECIACGCCVSSCTMVNYHSGYTGPAPLNRSFSLLMDSRDGIFDQRLEAVLESCYHCRTEFNCTEVCPKEISCTRAIKYIQRLALKNVVKPAGIQPAVSENRAEVISPPVETIARDGVDVSRRGFLEKSVVFIGAASALAVGSILGVSAVGQSLKSPPERFLPLTPLDRLPLGRVVTINQEYQEKHGFYTQNINKPIMVWRPDENEIIAYNSSCTHLGCTVHWDPIRQEFLCACHGGAFDLDGTVKAGPPPRPLDRYPIKIESETLLVKV